jgi:hypothetical protein
LRSNYFLQAVERETTDAAWCQQTSEREEEEEVELYLQARTSPRCCVLPPVGLYVFKFQKFQGRKGRNKPESFRPKT